MAALTADADPEHLIPGEPDDVDELARDLLRYADGAAEASRHLRAVEELVDPVAINPDRIGGPDGTYFGQAGDMFHTRSRRRTG